LWLCRGLGLLLWLCRGAKPGFYAQEGMVCVGGCWVIMSLLGCLPFYLSGQIPRYIDALFEIVSGFTTTGSSIVPDVEASPGAFCTGAASATGWAAWACWCFCWRGARSPAQRRLHHAPAARGEPRARRGQAGAPT
jgi:Trk-type K+ transport system membrane component